jgi:peptidoglycan/xylan/chitin deacetylase (PgdA/CDA1 family)
VRRGLLSVTVDLDPLDAYHAIHGLGPAPDVPADHLSAVAIPRFRELFERLGVRATFFAVGDDLGSERVAALLREAVVAGHEVGNHTHTHPYGFLDLCAADRATELERCHERIVRATGVAPVGFRAPGYFVDGVTLALLAERGYRYDSSMLPSWPYYMAKLGVLGLMRLQGRRSRSRLHPATSLLAPASPYRPDPGRPWRRGHAPLVELPAASLVAGVPLVGTFLGDLPGAAARLLARWLSGRRFLTVEFHAIDLVDPDDGGLDGLRGRQPGLEVPVARRLASFEALLAPLCQGAEAVTLAEAARRLPLS